ncbi:unnamed protein product [Bursaphelenchus xylophilus]|uniref:(pine wood nematode) hypothetical protein n=1 Tax=Bursaphelenchus xylophilus TaxID=6326 RepID=A0A1I7SQB4_BURXY|nr:unnamed protein product [Bursaphelenchus xylophilus]CAG9109692.1 unnamed protein product [Bursaphelenchus xylophilus]
MGCILVRACDPSSPDPAIRDFWHINGVLVDAERATDEDGDKVEDCPPGVLYVYNSKLIYRARHCLLFPKSKTRQLQFCICDIKGVNSCNKFTSLKDGRTFARPVVDISVTVKGSSFHVGFVTKDADRVSQRLQEVIDKHRQKPKIFQFNSVDVDGVEIDLP